VKAEGASESGAAFGRHHFAMGVHFVGKLLLETAAVEEGGDPADQLAHFSGGPQDGLNGDGGFLIFGHLALQLLEAIACEGVEANAAAGFRHAGFGGDPAFEKHALQRGIQRAFLRREHGIREDADTLGDRVSVEGPLRSTRRTSMARVPGGIGSLGIGYLYIGRPGPRQPWWSLRASIRLTRGRSQLTNLSVSRACLL